MTTTLKVGDVVRLKTGGPPMTVKELLSEKDCDAQPGCPEDDSKPQRKAEPKDVRAVWCVWFQKLDGGASSMTSPTLQVVGKTDATPGDMPR